MLRYVNDSNRTIYAFEMLPAPDIDNQFSDAIGNHGNTNDAPAGSDKTIKMQPNNATSLGDNSAADLQKSVPAGDVNSGKRRSAVIYYSNWAIMSYIQRWYSKILTTSSVRK